MTSGRPNDGGEKDRRASRRGTATEARSASCIVCGLVFPPVEARILVKGGHEIVRCPSCGLVFRSALPAREDLDGLYGSAYFAAAAEGLTRDGYLDYVADEDAHRANARRRLRRLSTFCAPGSLLDVGCAAGFFVDEAMRCGWTARGLDVSATMVVWGRARTKADLRIGTLADMPTERIESCITMWDYLEHSLDPRGDVEQAYARLRPGGILALSTGDVGSVLARVSLDRWHLMTPAHHNYFFSAHSIRYLLRSVGFDIAELGYPAAVFPVRYLAHKACLMADISLLDAVARRIARSSFGTRTIPVNLWDVMTVVARRPESAGRA